MSTRIIPWVEKYRPKRIDEVIGNPEAKKAFVAWLNKWMRGTPSKKALLMYGPPGIGKTSLVYAAAAQYDLELIEANASDVRTSQAIRRRIFRAVTETSLFGKRGKIILLDEVDGISPKEDRGGLQTILELIRISRFPVVLTANDPWDPKLRPLRDQCQLVEFRKIGKRDIIKVLQNICKNEKIECSYQVLSAIADNVRGDLRAAINDLQIISTGKSSISLEDLDILGYRAKQLNMFEVVRQVLTARRPETARMVLSMPSLDYEMLMLWLNENIIYQYWPSIIAIADAYDMLSRADVYLGRIKRKQYWSLLPYVLELMTVGVSSARERPPFKFVKYKFPEKLRMLSRSRNKRERMNSIIRSISKNLHMSSRKILTEVIPYLKIIGDENPSMLRKILKSMNISERSFREIFLTNA
ncbi:MAG: replication factor C large subunit [Thermoproteales archaeon]|nr:replication factor C large subunit [Thermoproteales archaeon]